MSIVADAQGVIAQDPVCDSCLGRVFADRSFGLTNAERGNALRIVRALEDDEPYDPTPTEDCWVCEGRCGEFDRWANWAANELAGLDFETYQVGTRVSPLLEENERLLREDAGLDPDAGEQFKSEFNREVGKRVGEKLGVDVDFERPDVVALVDLTTEQIEIQNNPAFVYGRYRKLERGIPQTEWPCRECHGTGIDRGVECEHCGGSGYLYETSVEEEVAPHVCDAMEGSESTFHGAGREDVEAVMQGTGRPFVFEVSNPRNRFPDVEKLEDTIHEAADGRVEVTDLSLATHEMVERVKELDASKTYRANVEFEASVDAATLQAAIDALDGATIEQDTPERVSHRRAAKTRTRAVYSITAELEDQHATIEVHGEGGLYIKELLHGDEGRTEPSLAGLVDVPVTVTSLDVIAVDAAEGSFADPEYLREPGS